MEKFWLVWYPGGGNPSKKHATLLEAEKEATRLAATYPEKDFYVLEAVCLKKGIIQVTTTTLNKEEEL